MLEGHCRIDGSLLAVGEDAEKLRAMLWPTVFAENIAVGHSVTSSQGTTLRVVDIIHGQQFRDAGKSPYLTIVLGRRMRK